MSNTAPILLREADPARTLPANVEAEAAFLGAVLIDNRILEEMTCPLTAEHFFAAVHGRVFSRIAALIDRKAVVTPVTLKPYFETDEGLKELGGTATIGPMLIGMEKPVQIVPMTAIAPDVLMLAVLAASDVVG